VCSKQVRFGLAHAPAIESVAVDGTGSGAAHACCVGAGGGGGGGCVVHNRTAVNVTPIPSVHRERERAMERERDTHRERGKSRKRGIGERAVDASEASHLIARTQAGFNFLQQVWDTI
jgi:hypothetical protein